MRSKPRIRAHTYAAHPKVAAIFFLLTNGREFRLYQISRPEQPIMTWPTEETVPKLMNIRNLLGPEAIKKRVHVPVDPRKPLAQGFNSVIEMIGGSLVRKSGSTDWKLMADSLKNMEGMRMTVLGKTVKRTEDGSIEGGLEIAAPFGRGQTASEVEQVSQQFRPAKVGVQPRGQETIGLSQRSRRRARRARSREPPVQR